MMKGKVIDYKDKPSFSVDICEILIELIEEFSEKKGREESFEMGIEKGIEHGKEEMIISLLPLLDDRTFMKTRKLSVRKSPRATCKVTINKMKRNNEPHLTCKKS